MFSYVRHGTPSLYAAFDAKTGNVLGATAPRHTSAEIVAFLSHSVANQRRGRAIHVIAGGVLAFVSDLKRKRYIGHYDTQTKPVKWKYFDPTHRIARESIGAGHSHRRPQ